MSKSIFFIHGGPGLNSFPEEALLGPKLVQNGAKVFFWNEPSALRPEGRFSAEPRSFQGWLKALEADFLEFSNQHGRVEIIGHSFGANGAVYLARKHPERVRGLVLVTPALNTFESTKMIARLCAEDFRSTSPEKAERIEQLVQSSRGLLDPPLREAIELGLGDPILFTHYWNDPARLEEWAAFASKPGGQMDLDAFFAILSSMEMPHLSRPERPLPHLPVLLVSGERDPVTNPEAEQALARNIFADVREKTISHTRHFPHLERQDEFVQLIIQGIHKEDPHHEKGRT